MARREKEFDIRKPGQLGHIIGTVLGGALSVNLYKSGVSLFYCVLSALIFLAFGGLAQKLHDKHGDIKIAKISSGWLFAILVAIMYLAMAVLFYFDFQKL